MKEVAESDELRVTIEKNSGLSAQFLVCFVSTTFRYQTLKWITFPKDATEGYENIIGDKLREDPSLLVVDVFGALENVVHQKAVYPGVNKKCSNICTLLLE